MAYPSDLKEEEWELIEKLFESSDKRGSASKHAKKQIVDGILYVVRTGVHCVIYRKIFRRGKLFMTITANGINAEFGRVR